LPPAIYAVIQYRLAQLSPAARELVDVAAVVGRSFTFEIVAQAGDNDEATLVRSLDELWRRRVVREHGAKAYDFSHDRIRDVAYAEISPARRRLLHRRVAQALEQAHAGTALDMVSGQVAAHYEQAGVLEKAVPYYRRAGLAAQQVYANSEAINHFTRALALQDRLPGDPQRDADELELQLALAVSIEVTKGWAAPELQPIHNRAWELCQHIGTPEQRFTTLAALCSFYHLRGETDQHQALAEQLVDIAEQWQTPVHLVPACMLPGDAHCMRGKLMLAQEQFEPSDRGLAHRSGHDRRHGCRGANVREPGVPARECAQGQLAGACRHRRPRDAAAAGGIAQRVPWPARWPAGRPSAAGRGSGGGRAAADHLHR
jgi:hypothetical protein